MSHIDKSIARIADMSAKERASWRQKTGMILAKSRGHLDASRLLDALDEFEINLPKPANLDVTGLLAWEKYQSGCETPFRAFHGDKVVGRILKHATHTNTRKYVYAVEILGQTVHGRWHNIADARLAGEVAFAVAYKSRQT